MENGLTHCETYTEVHCIVVTAFSKVHTSNLLVGGTKRTAYYLNDGGRVSSVGIATRYGLDGPGIESRRVATFSAPVPTCPGTQPASCTIGIGSFPRRGVEVKEKVELYLYFPSGPSWPVLG